MTSSLGDGGKKLLVFEKKGVSKERDWVYTGCIYARRLRHYGGGGVGRWFYTSVGYMESMKKNRKKIKK